MSKSALLAIGHLLQDPVNKAVFSFYRAMRCKRGLCCHAVSVCPSVRPSVTFVDHVKTNKHICEIF